jgi:hypothetical protein
MLGLATPPATTLQIVEAQAPQPSSTDQIRAALDRIRRKRLPSPDGSGNGSGDPDPSVSH